MCFLIGQAKGVFTERWYFVGLQLGDGFRDGVPELLWCYR